jgi:hypothetical protein
MRVNLGGNWEYDLSSKKWIRLLDGWLPGYFDSKGRRVLEGEIFDGDPFETAKAAMQPTPDEKQRFSDLLKRLDDDSYPVRDAASRELSDSMDRLMPLIAEAVTRQDLSLEVRARLEAALKANRGEASLFRLMHPWRLPPAATPPAPAPARG